MGGILNYFGSRKSFCNLGHVTHQVSWAGPGGSTERSQKASWRARSWRRGRGKPFCEHWSYFCDGSHSLALGVGFSTSHCFLKHHDSRRQQRRKRAAKRTLTPSEADCSPSGRDGAQPFSDSLTAEPLVLLSSRSDEGEDEDSTESERGAPRRSAHFYARTPHES